MPIRSVKQKCKGFTYPAGRAKRFLATVGLMVPVDEADDAEEESSSVCSTGNSEKPSVSSSCSSKESGSIGGKPANLALANDLCKSLIVAQFHGGTHTDRGGLPKMRTPCKFEIRTWYTGVEIGTMVHTIILYIYSY
jgi:hypothetical protein